MCKNNFYELGMNNLYDTVKALKFTIASNTSSIIQIP